MSSDNTDDVVDYWHLTYQGDLGLKEYMMATMGWTAEEWEHWAQSGDFDFSEAY